MAAWGKWVAIVGGVIAIIGNFWNPATFAYIPAIGGVVAVVGGFLSE